MTTSAALSTADQAARMDRIYRYRRHIYDATRRWWLLGRNRLLRELPIRPGDRVLEIGCGTSRNLVRLAKRHPEAHFYGLDISEQMLDTARKSIEKAGLTPRIVLHQGAAEALNAQKMYGLDKPFDIIFFSYSLCMIPKWHEALDAALANVRLGGTLAMVDFYDQKGWPRFLRRALDWWIGKFGVRSERRYASHFQAWANEGKVQLELRSMAARYVVQAVARKQQA